MGAGPPGETPRGSPRGFGRVDAGAPPRAPLLHRRRGLQGCAGEAYRACAAALPAARPEKMQPPRNVPSNER